jgi:uncharacterized protein
MNRILHFYILCLLMTTAHVAPALDIPYLTGRVNDYAQILTPEANNSLSEKLRIHEEGTTNQVVVLTLQSLDGESIDDFAYRVFNDWKLGQTGKDNGVLIVVVPDDRKMRIEVGYGLEATLSDVLASRIIQHIMAPRFREGDYNGGITEGAVAVIEILEGIDVQGLADLSNIDDSSTSGLSGLESPDLSIMERILIGAFIFGLIGLFTILGILTPGFGWFLYFFLIPFWAMFPIIVLGVKGAFVLLIIYLVGFPLTKLILSRSEWYKKSKNELRTSGTTSFGGMTFSSRSSGSSGSSWSSGGSSRSFSGGGGRSGGGGSSGGW